ncbi:MAG: glycosyltransferase [Candidatus Rokubacteria bacterium]|nr:glycosyltransferase [Candidatus Rokubacteria bacterium]
MSPPVDVVIITFNRIDLTKRTIECYRGHVRHPYRLICVDNGSTDGTPDYLRSVADFVIANSANTGPSRARNLGYAVTTSEYVLFSDNDIEFEADVITRLVTAMEHEPRLGLVAPLLQHYLEETGNFPTGASLAEMTAVAAARAPASLQDIPLLMSTVVLARRSMIEEIGPWDTGYGLYGHEDSDYTLRARARGWRAAMAPDCYVHHSGAGIPALPNREAIAEQSRQVLLRRWGIKGANVTGIVDPSSFPTHTRSAPSQLRDHLKLIERYAATCRLPADWPVITERFLAVMPKIGQDVLVVGCGSGEAVKQLRHRYRRHAIGLVPTLRPDDVYGVQQGHGYELPFDDGSLDAVIARHSLEHSPMPLVDLLETRRVLRQNGLAILSLPAPSDGTQPSLLPLALTEAEWRRLFAIAGLALLHADTERGGEGPVHRYILQKAGDP